MSIQRRIGLSSSSSPNNVARPANAVSRIAPALWMTLPVRMRSRSSPIAMASVAQTCSATSVRPALSR